ncbi:MAG: insulinase family protein [Candidatus Symbiothrix sp.]|jgi:predicted Zn-dependent peptidase|nr:insulinase family protein [Candidatus Symbiothrix sp.]
MKFIKLTLLMCFCALFCLNTNAQGLKAFQLPNGLSVFVWEDENVPYVYGSVAVNVGAKEDPENYTGLAHYLEHLLFNGTDKLGALDWEKEKPVYEQIIAKYDERAATTDPAQRTAISKEINQLTIEEAKYSRPNEFSGLIQSMGGAGLNAGTRYDYTTYHNVFPPGEIYKWLDIYSERLINPVFRNFQPELENVYEEYNLYQDIQERLVQEYIQSIIYEGHPYARPLIGLPEHLKNPQLSQLIQFYNTWYVPENMALILVGNIKTNEIIPVIKEKFGRLENRPIPERKQYPDNFVKGRKEVNAKIARYPQLRLTFPGISLASEDNIALEICTSILSNSSKTGLIDKLAIDGDIMAVGTDVDSHKDRGTIQIIAIPYYDANQRRFESLKSLEKQLLKEVKKLQEGQFEDWLVQSIKSKMIRMFDLYMEDPATKGELIEQVVMSGKDINYLIDYKEIAASITTEQIKETAKKYFGSDYYAIHLNEGKPAKGKEMEKPGYDPIIPVQNAESDYAKVFNLLPVKHSKDIFAKMDEVEIRPINDLSKLFYTKNPENDIFTLMLKFGVGTKQMPKLELAVQLMNNAGIMAQLEAQEFKQELSNLGATCLYDVDDSYLYVFMSGFEANLEAACNLMTRQILIPKLDEKQLSSLVGGEYQDRIIEKTDNGRLSKALREYLLYQKKSEYIDRLSLDDIMALSISNLTGEFQRATDYESQIHYVGTLPMDEVYDILSKNLPLKQGEKESTSPYIKERVNYTENTVLFLPNSDAKQSSIYFYIQGDNYSKEKDPYRDAFNQYFSGGFTGLVLEEIREHRSMAYHSDGFYLNPPVANKEGHFIGTIGTQADKTLEALDVYMDLLTNMPQYPTKMFNIKNYLLEFASITKPTFRDVSITYEGWKLRGYDKSPAETNIRTIDSLTFDDIIKFYNDNIKGRPVAIAIVGNPKMIDEKALAKYGKVIKLSPSKVFSDK